MGERYSVGRTKKKKKKKRIPNKIKKKNKSNPLNRGSVEGIFSFCCKKNVAVHASLLPNL